MQKVEENNKLIAEFMGLDKQLTFMEHPQTGEYIPIEEAKFHSSWDWLTPVIKKCHDIGTAFEWEAPESNEFEDIFYLDGMIYEFMQNDIESVHTRAVNFIKWYNEWKKEK